MARSNVPEADEILDHEFPVLDHGFVRLVDYLGSDQRIVQAARVSYGSGTKSFRQDRGLIRYLMRNEHTSPFEQVVLTFHTKMPVFVARQWVRHRTARLNEISGRYSVLGNEFYVPAAQSIAAQSSDNKQGRHDDALSSDIQQRVKDALDHGQKEAYRGYEELLELGVARELARINLPLSLYTEWYWQIDLHNLFHFLKLRMDPHAQLEIRAYAETMYEITRKVCPLACEAFEDYVRGAVSFSRQEFRVLQRALEVGPETESDSDTMKRIEADAREEGVKGKALERLLEKLRSGRQS